MAVELQDSMWVALLGAQVRYYDVNGIRTRVIECGDGPPVLFLHGGGGHAEAYAYNVVPLAEGRRIMAVDYLGHGLTDGPASGSPSKDDYVAHIIGLLDVIGAERAILAGESLGGWIAFWTALDHPERVEALISICGARLAVETDPDSDAHVRAGRADLKRRNEAFLADPSPATVRQRLEWLFHEPSKSISGELVDTRWAIYSRQRVQNQIKGMTDKAEHPKWELTPEELRRINQPTLMVWTSHNPSNTAATARRAADHMPDVRFELMEGCGHWPQWEDVDTFNALVSNFLAQR